MPSAPDFLSKLSTYNAVHGVNATFSEMKKTARRIERAYNDRPDTSVTADEYFLDYQDPTGEDATDNVMLDCAARNANNAARRVAA